MLLGFLVTLKWLVLGNRYVQQDLALQGACRDHCNLDLYAWFVTCPAFYILCDLFCLLHTLWLVLWKSWVFCFYLLIRCMSKKQYLAVYHFSWANLCCVAILWTFGGIFVWIYVVTFELHIKCVVYGTCLYCCGLHELIYSQPLVNSITHQKLDTDIYKINRDKLNDTSVV